MKISKFVLLMAITTVGLISCRKDDEPRSVAGTWEGKWGFLYETPSEFEKWDMEENGDLTSYFPDGTVYATGTWEEDGSDIEVNYTEFSLSNKYRFIGKYDQDEDEITGTWSDPENPIIGGTFEMKRK